MTYIYKQQYGQLYIYRFNKYMTLSIRMWYLCKLLLMMKLILQNC